MREQDHFRALVGQLRNRRRDAFDARRVGDDAVFIGHVEVNAHQNAFALHVGMVESAEVVAHERPRALD
jgi:hypothetical protein